jgi:hypothetical protein
MITLSRARQLIDSGLSLITIGDDKIPNYPWKKYQSEKIDKDVFSSNYNNQLDTEYEYKGGKRILKATKGVGIVTGYNGLEVIDIDLKVLPSLKEQQDFWNEYINFLKDNIDDFDDKFCIYKTVNNGYHILYKGSTIDGICCRLDDKLARISKAGITGDTEDSIGDLIGYLVHLEICLGK